MDYKLTQVPQELTITESGLIRIYHDSLWENTFKSTIKAIIAEPGLHIRIEVKIIARKNCDIDCNLLGIITKKAAETDLYISVKSLILNEKSHVSITPSLEIHHNEVKAGHGASIGYLNPHELWYLQQRGLNHEQSEHLLVEAFMN